MECAQGEGGRGDSVSISGSGGGGVCELSPGGTERIPPVFSPCFLLRDGVLHPGNCIRGEDLGVQVKVLRKGYL